MATQNAINKTFDPAITLAVNKGGTGAATLTDHGVLCGSGTGAITPLTVGATGELLVGTASSDPAFAASMTGDFTFTSATASAARVLTINNTSNSANSAAKLQITVGGANVGDPQISHIVTGATTWSTGIDNSDSDKFKLSCNASLGTADTIIITSNGEVTKPLQPAFCAYANDAANVTGDSTLYTIIYDNERFDVTSDFDTATGTFTAPQTGKYLFNFTVLMGGCLGTHRRSSFVLTTTSTTYGGTSTWLADSKYCRTGLRTDDTTVGEVFYTGTMTALMTAGDTAIVKIKLVDGTKTADVVGANSYFSGYLVC